MVKVFRVRWWAGLAVLMLALTAAAGPLQVRDDRGLTVTLAQPPQRVVTLIPALTEMVCELGACDRLVGVDDFSNWPASVRSLPHVGGLEDARIEAIVALRPDLVLSPLSSRALARMEALGLKVGALETHSIADVRRVLLRVGEALGSGGAEQAWQRIDAQVEAAARGLPPALRGTRVYFEVDSGPYAASGSSFIGQLLARLDLANVVPGALGPFPKLNPEFVVRADPQVILLAQAENETLRSRPGWSRIRALRERRVCAFTPAQGDVLVRPGPRMAQAAQLMVQCVQGRWPGPAP